ncbi:MAG TPA: ferritin-like domain-containing protein [Gaiellaceae bacterium]|nr:ferritin-like domain-containing protein [Gaiellaceae bacterium]
MSAVAHLGPGRRSRRELLAAGLVGGSALASGLFRGGDPAAAGGRSPAQDERILNFALGLEYLQAAFYAEADARGGLAGELATFARVVGEQERRHVAFLRERLGAAARAEPGFDLADVTADADSFREAALVLEHQGVAAYVGQGANLSVAGVAAIAPLVSVEARHAAWILDLAGENPAPAAADPATTVDGLRAALAEAGLELPE